MVRGSMMPGSTSLPSGIALTARGVRDEAHIVHTFCIKNFAHKHGRNVNAIADDFNIEIFERKHTFHNTHLLKIRGLCGAYS